MKQTKRLLSLLLAVAMLVSSMAVVFAEEEVTEISTTSDANFSDVAEDALYATAVDILNQMSIINGYPDGTFGPDKNVTRAEFTAMLMRTLNYGSVGSTSAKDLPFSDVNDADTDINWAIPNINTAYAMGIVNGYPDGTFGPRNNVSYEEAVKMVVCALGYVIENAEGKWYSNYISQANRLGVTQSASLLGAVETPASRSCIAQMLYDSLEVPLCEQGEVTKKTILSDYLRYYKNTGVISSNGITGLTAPDVNLNNNEVQIYAYEKSTDTYETYTYKCEDKNLKDYLGYEIEYYYKSDGSVRNLEIYTVTQNKEASVDPASIETTKSSATQIAYYESDDATSTSTLNLAADNVVIYNGKLYGANAASSRFKLSMIPQVGNITLLDSDVDGRYDLVFIDAYEIYYVSTKVSADYEIIDDVTRTGDAKRLNLDVTDRSITTTIEDEKGAEVSFSAIPTGSILCVANSNAANGGEKLRKVVVVNSNVSGTVTAVDARKNISINTVKYEYSAAAPWLAGNSGTLTTPALQDSGTYCLDINGRIVAYKKNATTENIYYGYIMGYTNTDSAFADEKLVRILSQNGTQLTALIDSETVVYGQSGSVTGSATDVIEFLEDSNDAQNTDTGATGVGINQVVKYTYKMIDNQNVIQKIYTALATPTGVSSVEADELTHYTAIDASDAMTYRSSGSYLVAEDGTMLKLSSPIVFMVPSNRSSFSEYSKTGASAFKNTLTYNVEAFDVTTTGNVKVLVCYGQDSSAPVDVYTPVSVVTAMETQMNDTVGFTMPYMLGYQTSYTGSKSELGAWVSDESTHTPEAGDVFRAGSDRDGNSKVLSENMLYCASGGNLSKFGKVSTTTDFFDSSFAVILGSVAVMDDESISITPQYLGEGDTVTDIMSGAVNFNFSEFAGANVLSYRYDSRGDLAEIIQLEAADIEGTMRGLTEYSDGLTNPTKVLIYMCEGKVRLVCILGTDIAL